MIFHWQENEEAMIAGLKRHLEKPYPKWISKKTCYAVQQLMRYMKNNISLTELWELPHCRWNEFDAQSSHYDSTMHELWKWEMIQTLSSLVSGKRMDFSHPLISHITDFLLQAQYDEKPDYLPQPFPGHPLKEYALEGDAVKCKLQLDLANNPEKKLQSVLQIMLNSGHFQAAADLHTLCGGGLEKIDRKLLLSVWKNISRGNTCESFDLIVMQLLRSKELFPSQHATGKWGERMKTALESGRVNGNTVIFVDECYTMTLGKYMHFLYEIREELLKVASDEILLSDITASEIFVEWEKEHEQQMV